MPKSTFYNIPEEKRERIRKAGLLEFSNNSFREASINKIIKEADIPRGSFYQYFEDKRDLFIYVFSDSRNIVFEELNSVIEKADGNLFVCIEMLVDPFINCVIERQFNLINIIAGDPEVLNIFWDMITQEKNQGICESDFTRKVDTTILKVDNERDMVELLKLINTVLREKVSTFVIYKDRMDKDEYRQEFINQIRFLRRVFDKTYEDTTLC